ncbi:hypothetical protein T459_28287 [Capsicum annuum]|uniref:Uncharacterized protein n=1 Tax=Capsicum annuum TaxID=4072 RepID=A0A2G2YGF2_CAPAN|nr:hypothetical protein T459_28287 [Capsicum annuum]
MMDDGLRADQRMMVVVISSCAKLGDLRLGQKLHEYVRSYKLNFDVFFGNALVDMYLKCSEPDMEPDYSWIYQRNIDNRMGDAEIEDADDEL